MDPLDDPDVLDAIIEAAPLLMQPLRPPRPQQGLPFSLSVALGEDAAADAARIHALLEGEAPPRRDRPAQGGQRITEEWLRSLAAEECRYRFKYVLSQLVHICATAS